MRNAQAGTSTTDNNDFHDDLHRRRQRQHDVQLEPRDARAAVRLDRPLRRPLLGRRHVRRRRRRGRAGPRLRARSCSLQTPTATRYSTITRERPRHRRDLVDPLPGRSPTSRASSPPPATASTPSANIETGTGSDRYGGWGLVVVYRNPAESARRLLVYDGLLALQSGLRPTADISLSGFVTPPSGTVVGRLGILAWEGDRGITGDAATFAGRALSDTLNPVTNVFNSTISRAGVATTGRTPSYVNQLGVDKDEFTIDGFLANNATTATLHLETATDLYLPGAIALAFDEGPPLATAAPTISGTARDGQTLTADPGVWHGIDADHLRLPVAPLRRRRRELRRHRGRDRRRPTRSAPPTSGSTIRVVVTATNAAGRPPPTSTQTATVAPTPPVNTTPPSISGHDARRRDPHAPTPAPGPGTPTIAYAYQWRRCDTTGASCADIAGATGATYTLTAADVGATSASS